MATAGTEREWYVTNFVYINPSIHSSMLSDNYDMINDNENMLDLKKSVRSQQ